MPCSSPFPSQGLMHKGQRRIANGLQRGRLRPMRDNKYSASVLLGSYCVYGGGLGCSIDEGARHVVSLLS